MKRVAAANVKSGTKIGPVRICSSESAAAVSGRESPADSFVVAWLGVDATAAARPGLCSTRLHRREGGGSPSWSRAPTPLARACASGGGGADDGTMGGSSGNGDDSGGDENGGDDDDDGCRLPPALREPLEAAATSAARGKLAELRHARSPSSSSERTSWSKRLSPRQREGSESDRIYGDTRRSKGLGVGAGSIGRGGGGRLRLEKCHAYTCGRYSSHKAIAAYM
eukprot:3601604-Pleurochrysis_carterae.AAC.2